MYKLTSPLDWKDLKIHPLEGFQSCSNADGCKQERQCKLKKISGKRYSNYFTILQIWWNRTYSNKTSSEIIFFAVDWITVNQLSFLPSLPFLIIVFVVAYFAGLSVKLLLGASERFFTAFQQQHFLEHWIDHITYA